MSIYQGSETNPERRPSLKGAVMVDVSMGKERVRAWPRKRGENVPPNVKANQILFRQYSWAIKYLAPDMMAQIYDARQGTPLLPRDIAMMMLSGTLLWFSRPNGKAIYSMAALQAVSQSLDAITQLQGSVLVRGETYWEAVPYTPSGQPWWWAPPDPATWTFKSFNTQQIDAVYSDIGGLSLGGGAISSGQATRIMTVPLTTPTQPWSLDFRMEFLIAGENYRGVGLCLRDPVSGKMMILWVPNDNSIAGSTLPGLTGFGSTWFQKTLNVTASYKFWRVISNGTNISWYLSPDGIRYTYITTQLLTFYLGTTPKEIGVMFTYNTTQGFETSANIQRWVLAQ